jgi:undecaprenyl phosphate N,N'-diacetylbacillosamine 1-phosphate transferase
MEFYRNVGKRILDLFVSVVGLIILCPVILVFCVVLFIQNRGHAFFVQERPGFNETSFKIIKFKTMNDRRDKFGKLLPDSQRITRTGSWIRSLSLDELPQLFNVVKGDMSLVGPRPLLFKYIPLYSEHQRKRHKVKPGITGWAQVNGRNSISWAQKFEYDSYYVEHVSFRLDISILWLTLLKVIKREGVNQSAAAPMQPFNGSN